jgi:glycosyltransferase involved in cell wall biosynthesis
MRVSLLHSTTESYMEVTPELGPKKRILYAITKANWGGAQRYVYDLAVAAKGAGHEVLVVSGSEGELTTRLRHADVMVAPIAAMQRDIKLAAEWRSFKDLVRYIRSFKPDVVHANSSKAGGLAGLAARLVGVKRIIFTAHGWAFNEDRPLWQRIIIWWFHYATVLLAHTTICVSEAMRREARSMPLVQGRFQVIHNGISEVPLRARGDARHALAPSLTLPFWIGTIAELHPTKQLDVLIRAFATLEDTVPDSALVIMGEGEDRGRLTALIHQLQLTDRILLLGHVSDAPSYLSALDIFALPSRSESFGFVLLEAGMATLPVVASNVGGIPEIIENNETGLLVPPGDTNALADALSLLAGDAALRTRLSAAFHAHVLARFSKKETTEKTLALYDGSC